MIDKIWFKTMKVCSHTCHQQANRSYFIGNYQMPICARCLGLAIGYISTLLIYDNAQALYTYVLMLIPLMVDGIVQLKSKYESTNFKRLVTGFIAGIGFMSLFIRAIIWIGGL